MIHYTLYFILFLFGLCVGSFLNAVIWRLETGESVIFFKFSERKKNGIVIPVKTGIHGIDSRLRGNDKKKKGLARSHCPHCRQTLKWHDLVPVFSFLFLRGKCRYCKKPISWQYPIVEIATGILFVIIGWEILGRGTGNWEIGNRNLLYFCYMLYVSCSMIVIFVYDLRHYIIPDRILFPAIGVALLYRVSEFFLAFDFAALRSGNKILFPELVEGFSLASPYFIAAIIGSGFFLALVLISRGKWMGLGDVKLAFLMGLILGWPDIAVALFFAFSLGAIIGLILILMSGSPTSAGSPTSKYWNYSLKSHLPFGPFLIVGTFIALFWGAWIIDWYLNFLS